MIAIEPSVAQPDLGTLAEQCRRFTCSGGQGFNFTTNRCEACAGGATPTTVRRDTKTLGITLPGTCDVSVCPAVQPPVGGTGSCPAACPAGKANLLFARVTDPLNPLANLDLARAKLVPTCVPCPSRQVPVPLTGALPMLGGASCGVSVCVPEEVACFANLRAPLTDSQDLDGDGFAELLEHQTGTLKTCVKSPLNIVDGDSIKVRLNVESFEQHNGKSQMDTIVPEGPDHLGGEPFIHEVSVLGVGLPTGAKPITVERFTEKEQMEVTSWRRSKSNAGKQLCGAKKCTGREGDGKFVELDLPSDITKWGTRATPQFGELGAPSFTATVLLLDHDSNHHNPGHSSYLNSKVQVTRGGLSTNTLGLAFQLFGNALSPRLEKVPGARVNPNMFQVKSLTDSNEPTIKLVPMTVTVPDAGNVPHNSIEIEFSLEFFTPISTCRLHLLRTAMGKLDRTGRLTSVITKSSLDAAAKRACNVR